MTLLAGAERERVRNQARGDGLEPQWPAHGYDGHSVDRQRPPACQADAAGTHGQSLCAGSLQPDAASTRDELAGLGDKAIIDFDLVEWNYGEYERLTPEQIQEITPGWLIFRDGCPGGETPEHIGARVDRVIARSRAMEGDTALFAHGHVLRVFVARWIGLPPGGGQHFLLNTGTLCVLGYYGKIPAVGIWNGPLLD